MRRDALEQLSAKMRDPSFAFFKDFPKWIVTKALRGKTFELRNYASDNCGAP